MARTTELIAIETTRRKYHWPEAQLNLWMLIMTVGSALELGIFVFFFTNQTQMGLDIPWIMPYQITLGCVSLTFLGIIMWLISQRQLLPGVVLVGSFIMFCLYVGGLVEIGIQMFGPFSNNVATVCQKYVSNMPHFDVSVATLAFIAQKNICNCWDAAFAFQLVCSIFLLWMMIMAFQVNDDEY